MDPSEWVVIAASVAAIAWVNWYFFFAERSSTATQMTSSGAEEVAVTGVHAGRDSGESGNATPGRTPPV